MSYVLISFQSPHHTIKADKELETTNIQKRVYPIPRQISRDCGLGLKIKHEDLNEVLAILDDKDILYKKTFPVDKNDKLSLIDKFSSNNNDK